MDKQAFLQGYNSFAKKANLGKSLAQIGTYVGLNAANDRIDRATQSDSSELGNIVGGLGLGLAKAKKGREIQGAAAGAFLSKMMDKGSTYGSVLGFLPGGIAGAILANYIGKKYGMSDSDHIIPLLGGLAGGGIGSLLGAPVGAYGGYQIGKNIIGEKSMDKLFVGDEDEEEEPQKKQQKLNLKEAKEKQRFPMWFPFASF